MLENLPTAVTVYEVGPRDGLQNESTPVSTADKVKLIKALAHAGLKRIEITSFVSPKWIPQLADGLAVAEQLAAADEPEAHGLRYCALVPNLKGYEGARLAGLKEIAVFMSATESHNLKNINKTTEQALAAVTEVTQAAKADGLYVRGYLSVAFVCPYEGVTNPNQVVSIADKLIQMGVDELSIGDTIGGATPKQVLHLMKMLAQSGGIKTKQIALHFHDTYGMATANVLAGLEAGITTFDASVGGMGGCPYAPGAAGNLASEDLVYLLNGLGVDTGVDLPALIDAGRLAESILAKKLPGRYLQACLNSKAGKKEVRA